MEVKGRVFQVLETISGTSAKGEWSKQSFVIETLDQYPKKVCFEVWNGKIEIPKVGDIVSVSFNAESREYQGRWFTSLGAWKIKLEDNSAPSPQQRVDDAEQTMDGTLPSEEPSLPF